MLVAFGIREGRGDRHEVALHTGGGREHEHPAVGLKGEVVGKVLAGVLEREPPMRHGRTSDRPVCSETRVGSYRISAWQQH